MAPSPTIRRLLRECAELSSAAPNPSPTFYAAPVSDADLHEWHFTLLGPPSPSPYAGGLYHGRITLPATYPLKPPNFRFLTPSGRFETNREICLSISGFHEETWMPAWGVRTALTALRTFMAEPGTAGQVGGLESSDQVRRKLAKESKSWRCDSCGKRNEAIMKEWWAACREQGVNVDDEGEMGLERLPEGMMVEARTPGSTTEKGEESEASQSSQMTAAAQTRPSPEKRDSPTIAARRSSSGLPPPTALRHAMPFVATPSAEAAQASAEARLEPSDFSLANSNANSARRSGQPIRSIHAPPVAAALAAQQQEQQPTLTIDRAIAGIFLALCLMLLKKIFYPASTRDLEDFYLQREI